MWSSQCSLFRKIPTFHSAAVGQPSNKLAYRVVLVGWGTSVLSRRRERVGRMCTTACALLGSPFGRRAGRRRGARSAPLRGSGRARAGVGHQRAAAGRQLSVTQAPACPAATRRAWQRAVTGPALTEDAHRPAGHTGQSGEGIHLGPTFGGRCCAVSLGTPQDKESFKGNVSSNKHTNNK